MLVAAPCLNSVAPSKCFASCVVATHPRCRSNRCQTGIVVVTPSYLYSGTSAKHSGYVLMIMIMVLMMVMMMLSCEVC
jgi:hypothetical protein